MFLRAKGASERVDAPTINGNPQLHECNPYPKSVIESQILVKGHRDLFVKMVYDWDNKDDLCYRMYIEEKKSLEDIMDYMKEHHKFNPR